MAKLTKAQVSALEIALHHLRRADKYIMNDSIAVARRDRQGTTTLHYIRSTGEALYEVNKEYGSDLIGLRTGIKYLENLISPPILEKEVIL